MTLHLTGPALRFFEISRSLQPARQVNAVVRPQEGAPVGLFVHLVGNFECLRCRRKSTDRIQTKLLRHEADNSCRDYRVGDAEELVGLGDYCPLDPWDDRSPLVVVVGEWDCRNCGLGWQWAKATFEVRPVAGDPIATLRELVDFRPWQAADLVGVNFADEWLAAFSGLWASGAKYNWFEGIEQWRARPLAERRERVAAGFRQWCREIAGVSHEAEPNASADGGRDSGSS